MRIVLVTALTLFCTPLFAAPELVPMPDAKQRWAAEIEDGKKAMGGLISKLGPRLQAALKSGGPVEAVKVCAEVAQPITESVNENREIEVGRSSHKLRNPANLASEWVAHWLASNAPGKAVNSRPGVYDLGERIGIVKAISTQMICMKCHGDPDGMPAQLKAVLKEKYPNDQATGFRPGDIRGVIWAQVPKKTQ